MGNTRPQSPGVKVRIAADNRKARHLYHIDDTFEAGLMLTGTEVKALRAGEANIQDAYAEIRGGEPFLVNCYIAEWSHGNRFNHEPRRPRKLLLHKRQIDKLDAAVARQGFTLVPLNIYFNDKNRAKVELGLCRGKQLHDKRQDVKTRDWDREKARLLRDKG